MTPRLRVGWVQAAERDRDSQLAYITERNPRAAIDLGDVVEAADTLLSEHPFSGRSGKVKSSREFAVPAIPYVLVYRAEKDAVVILRLLHGARNWPTSP